MIFYVYPFNYCNYSTQLMCHYWHRHAYYSKKFTNPKRTYEFCFKIPKVIGIVEVVLLIIGLVLLICFYIFGDINVDKIEIYLFSFLLALTCGPLIGCIIGEIYWCKIKKTFFRYRFNDKFQKYSILKTNHVPFVRRIGRIFSIGIIPVRYGGDPESDTCLNFLCPVTAFSILMGFLISYLI